MYTVQTAKNLKTCPTCYESAGIKYNDPYISNLLISNTFDIKYEPDKKINQYILKFGLYAVKIIQIMATIAPKQCCTPPFSSHVESYIQIIYNIIELNTTKYAQYC